MPAIRSSGRSPIDFRSVAYLLKISVSTGIFHAVYPCPRHRKQQIRPDFHPSFPYAKESGPHAATTESDNGRKNSIRKRRRHGMSRRKRHENNIRPRNARSKIFHTAISSSGETINGANPRLHDRTTVSTRILRTLRTEPCHHTEAEEEPLRNRDLCRNPRGRI